MTAKPNVILSSDKLPSLPGVALRVIELAREPETGPREIVHVIKSDPALAAKILRTVNSGLFGLRHQITTIEQAVPMLGLMPLSNLVLGFSLLPHSTEPGPMATHFEQFWRSSLTQAVAADELAKRAGGGLPAEYFVAGLLVDVGSLALLRALPDEYLAVLEEFCGSERPLCQIEQERLGTDHARVGFELCRRWGLSPRLQQALVGHHTTPSEFSDAGGVDCAPLQTALATAAAVAEYFYRSRRRAAGLLVQELADRHYRITGDELHAFLETVSTRVRQAADLFSLDIGQSPTYAEILDAANAELAKIAGKARCDALARFWNRNEFHEQLERLWKTAIEEGESIGVVAVDIDGFGQLNQEHGAALGDELLRVVAELIASLARDSSGVARSGADEFAILVPHATDPTLLLMAEEARRAIACHVTHPGSQGIEITASVGAAICAPRSGAALRSNELLRVAEDAQQRARRAGGNQVRVVSISPNGSKESPVEPFIRPWRCAPATLPEDGFPTGSIHR